MSPHAPAPVATSTPFHEGERGVQERLGVRDAIEPWARRVVRPYLPEEHRVFYAQLPFVVLAARDRDGRPWATLLADEPGFLSSPDPATLEVAALPPPGDALADALRIGDDVGLLGIELETRRRNRANGRVGGRTDRAFELAVEQGFGNCPQYITQRRWQRAPREAPQPRASRSRQLSPSQQALVGGSDTLFLASGFGASTEGRVYGMDASHRGGAPGFVSVLSPSELVFPDYAGNNHFNTLGNLVMDSRVGLLLVEFETGGLLQMSGRARIDWDSPEIERHPGARRMVHIDIDAVVALRGALPIRWGAAGESVRELRVVKKRRESADVASFYFTPRDGGPLADYCAGQHLPLLLNIPGQAAPVPRTYSLSSTPGDPCYRISVKREAMGLASRYLHDQVEVGTIVSASAPQGSFTLRSPIERPTVLVSAGIGLTPMLSMLVRLARVRSEHPVWFVHGARDGEHHPLRLEVERATAAAETFRHHTAYSRPRPTDLRGRADQSRGRVDGALLESLVPGLAAELYLCGPRVFMSSLQAQLEARGVPESRIHCESFGPTG